VTWAARIGVIAGAAIVLLCWLAMSSPRGETAAPGSPAPAASAAPALAAAAPAAAKSASIEVETWNDPVKAVLERHDVTLKAVNERASDGYRTFDVAFKFDPQSPATTGEFHKLYAEVLEANRMHPYAFRDSDDGYLIEVRFDAAKKELTTNFIALK
jgi:phage terminase large subunit-like protein